MTADDAWRFSLMRGDDWFGGAALGYQYSRSGLEDESPMELASHEASLCLYISLSILSIMFKFLRMPRLNSWRHILISCSAFVLFWICVLSLTPLTSPLPPYTGAHEVGILDVEVEVQKRVLSEAALRSTGEKAFEVCFSFTFYVD